MDTSDLDPNLLLLGQLTGLLTVQGSTFNLDTTWFSQPVIDLQTMQTRLDLLVQLIDNLLGPSATNPASTLTNANWYQIPDPLNGNVTPFYVVTVPGASDSTTGQLGLGWMAPFAVGNLQLEPYIYIPLFAYSSAGTSFIADDAQSPSLLGLSCTTVDGTPFSVTAGSSQTTFSAMDLAVFIPLTGADPTASLNFSNLTGAAFTSPITTLAGVKDTQVLACLGEVATAASYWLHTYVGSSNQTIGDLLTAGGFFTQDATTGDYLLNIANLQGSALQITQNFAFAALDALADLNTPILPLFDGGIYIDKTSANGLDTYGLCFAANFDLDARPNTTGSAPPNVTVSLGSWLTGENNTGNWMTRSLSAGSDAPEAGLIVSLLSRDANQNITWTPGFDFSSVGINVTGQAGNALFAINGYTLAGVELRATLNAVDVAQPSTWSYGFAVKLYELGFPLVPAVSGSAGDGSNPVAQNLLQTSDGTATTQSAAGDQNPVNPTFGVAVSWYLGGTFDVQLYDQNDTPTTQVLLPINRTLGPLECQKLGIGWVNSTGQLSLLFDGGVSVGALSVMLDGLSVNIPLNTPATLSNYSLDLDGMGITFTAGPVSLDAAFVKVPANPPGQPYTEYDGTATIQAGSFAISALGSYAYLPPSSGESGYASLFIFGVMLEPLGGPEFFFVTGLAAGFGYNRGLNLPTPDAVTNFPFVAGLNNPTMLGIQADGSFPNPAAVLAKIDSFVPPQRGEYWLAAGVRFTSFDLIHASALVSVAFGQQLEIAVLGDAWLSIPPPPSPTGNPPDQRFGYIEMGIEIEILPAQGVISATAILTNNSYVIDPGCHLTGGFAFYVWFGSNPHAGEFVLTIGGYNPQFSPPSYYPQVPRLGFNWPVTNEVTISGDAYFALTSSCIMVGGGLQIVFNSGNLHAWFTAQMDALVAWAPFHYELDISVSIGVSYRLHLLFVTTTLKVELGASINLWGPRMGGVAHISWYIISFSVGFGADQSSAPAPLAWEDANSQGFSQTLLPNTNSTTSQSNTLSFSPQANAPAPSPGILTITAQSGLVSTITDSNGNTIWIVNPSTFSFSTLTAFPLLQIDITPVSGETAQTTWNATDVCPDGADYYVYVRPMDAAISQSTLTVTLTDDETNQTYDLAGLFDLALSIVSTQAAKWAQPPAGGTPEMNATLNGRLFGFQSITPQSPMLTPAGADALSIDITTAFTPDVVDPSTNYLPLNSTTQPNNPVPQVNTNAWSVIQSSLQDATVSAARQSIFETLIEQFGYDAQTNGNLSSFPANPGAFLNGTPLILPAAQSATGAAA